MMRISGRSLPLIGGPAVPRRVLVADDNQGVCDQVSRVLGDALQIVGVAHNGRAAVQLAASLCPDLIMLDISMPVMDGIQAARQLLAADPQTRIIFLTASEEPEMARLCLGLGAVGYVAKSRMARDLLLAVEHVMEGRSFVSCSVLSSREAPVETPTGKSLQE